MAKARRQTRIERARLQAIRAVDLDESRPALERIARIAKRLAGTPIASVDLAEEGRLWLAGVSDLPLPTAPREHSFTNLTIQQDGVFWVEDATTDPRFGEHWLVRGEPHVRFYAGAPIRLSDGAAIGSLAVLDVAPRAFEAGLAVVLEDLASLVADEYERRRALRDLAASESEARAAQRLLLNVVSNAPVALVMTDRRLRILEHSAQWLELAGLGDVPVRGRSMYDLFPDNAAEWRPGYDRALAGETLRWPRARINLADGRRLWLQVEVTPWRDGRGRVGGLLVMSYDIGDMVEALEATKRSEQSLKLAMEIGQLSMWELDHRRRALNAAGPAVSRSQTGFNYQRMSSDPFGAIHPHDRPQAEEAWRRYEATGEPYRAVFRLMQLDGPHIWVQSATEAIRDDQGRIERVVGVLRNIDTEKRAEMALARAKDAAEAANRAKSEFLANMSHEIRTPLNGVMGVASALSRTELTAHQREMVALIESSAGTLASLLSDVLDLARIESGRMTLAHEPFDLRRCITDVGALFKPIADAKNLSLVAAPASEIEGLFLGDAARVRQILTNLIANAIKFTPSGEVRIAAQALRTPDGVEARIVVQDTGIGFDEDTKARLFDRFEQADGSITRRYGGSGLGLAISRSLAEQMGGRLEAEGELGHGATFTVVLPLTRAAAPMFGGADEEEARAAPAAPDGSPLRVLLAEDHPTNRRVVELILGAAGVSLTCVENGRDAVDAWRREPFDLVLMDMQMPVMDGLTAIRRIRELEAADTRAPVPIHALTANAMPEHAEASRAAGADGHLTKPITAEALFRVVEAAASGERNGSAVRRRA